MLAANMSNAFDYHHSRQYLLFFSETISREMAAINVYSQSELPRPIKIRTRMYERRSIMYEKATFCSPEENSSVAR